MTDSWWKKAVFYEVYMPSFADGNGDGIGDFTGLTEKLDYLADLGVNGLWLTPFYPSPKVDNGYDISDYCSVDSDFGSMADFDRFIDKAHRHGLKVVIDLVLNHTSAEHEWFQQALMSPEHPKRDWYIWREPVNGGPPNNWESFFGGSAWEYEPVSGQYYYHAFAKEQVDLNWANPEVVKEMKHVMDFWLNRGVDGFRLDVINFLKVNQIYPDNPWDEDLHEQIHLFDKDQEGILTVIQELADHVHQRPGKVLIGEVGSVDIHVLERYAGKGRLDMVFNFNIGSLPVITSETVVKQLNMTYENYDASQYPTLFFSSHDMPRLISRFGSGERDEARARSLAVLQMTAKGIPFIYYGDEIGVNNYSINHYEDLYDIQGKTAYQLAVAEGDSSDDALEKAKLKSRDASRSPMPWNVDQYGGFSANPPWMPLAKGDQNAEKQEKDTSSMLHFYKTLIQLRHRHSALSDGEISQLEETDGLITFTKTGTGETCRVALNFNDSPVRIPWDKSGQFLWSSRDNQENNHTLAPFESRIWKRNEESHENI